MQKRIKGKVVYQDLGMGCWGIVDQAGVEYRPVNMPEQLKKVGANVTVLVTDVEEDFSMMMWGEAVRIVGFHTLG